MKIVEKEVLVEVIKEIEVEKIIEVPVDRIIEIPTNELIEKEAIIGGKIKDVPVNKDKFSSASLRRPDGTSLELKRNPLGKGKLQGSLSDIGDPGVLTKKDRVDREISKNTGQKRLDPWTGNKRWQKAKYDENDEDKK